MRAPRRRLDAELVRRELAADRGHALDLIARDVVTVGGAIADNPARMVSRGEPIELLDDRPREVSRGARKLAGVLDRLDVDPRGRRCLDAGSSTGGFTEALLERGARSVVAVDVGYGLLHERLVADPRVDSFERTNVRHLRAGAVGEPVEVVVADLSFISLRAAIDPLAALLAAGADMVLLVKPQFEATRAEADRSGGVITDPSIWKRVIGEVADYLNGAGFDALALVVSPVPGPVGNREFFLHARYRLPDATGDPIAIDDHLIDPEIRAAAPYETKP